jgi:hypothetical protein
VALTAARADYLRSRRRAGTEALPLLVGKLLPGEAAALLAPTQALRHLYELDNQRRAVVDQGFAWAESLSADRSWR